MKRGNKLWKRVLTAALSLAVAGACLPFGALAEEPEATESVNWAFSKSKTATNLDENFESKVTLSLPSAEEQLVSDVVFVLDKSTSSTVKEAAVNMLSDLQQQVAKTGAKVKVGVVIFNEVANRVLELTELNETNMTQIETAINTNLDHGTNSHAGLLAGEAMLDEDTAVDKNRKYLIFISDGITYIFGEDGMSITTRRYVGVSKTNEDEGTYLIKYQDSMVLTAGTKKYQIDNEEVDFIANAGGVEAYIQGIKPLVEADGKKYWVRYDSTVKGAEEYLTTSSSSPSDTPAEGTAPVLKGDNGLKNQKEELFNTLVGGDGINEHANNVDTALYFTYQAYQEAASKYHCYTMLATEYSKDYPWSATFMRYLKGDKDVDFSQIQNDIYYLLDAGSRVEDYIGYAENDYDFDFVNDASALSLKVGDTEYAATKIEENHYGFALNETGYDYELTYIRGNGQDEERFVWNINVPVSNFAPVQLTYTVKLTNPKTEAGTYGEYDADGSQNKTGLYTNNIAVLYPVDSNGNNGSSEEFPKPTVSYTVEAQPTPTPAADPTPAPTPKDEHPEIAQAIKDGTWGKADPTPAPSADPAVKVTSTHIPQTGDTSSPVLWVVAMVAALAAFAGVVILRRRSNKD